MVTEHHISPMPLLNDLETAVLPWWLSRSVIDSVGLAGAEFAQIPAESGADGRPAGWPGWSAHIGRFGAVRVSAVAARGGGGCADERGDVAGCAVLRPSDDDRGCGGVVYRPAYQAGVQLAAGGFGHYGDHAA